MAVVRDERSNGRRKEPIAVLGMGHVGLPTALGFAELGWKVLGADDAVDKIEQLKTGKATFYEPEMQELLTKHLASGRFQPTKDVDAAIAAARVVFVCVGTPQRDDGAADLSQIEAVARTIARNLNGYKLVVEKSTVPASTAERIKRTIARYARTEPSANGVNGRAARAGAKAPAPRFDVASNPEFLQEGKAIQNFFHPERIVIGVESDQARELLEEIYRPLKCPIVVTDLATSELIKHSANAFLSTKISFINMISDLCEAVGADVASVARGIGLDPRIGQQFLNAGIGFGGYCFPKDLRALIYLGEEHGAPCGVLRAVEEVNLRRIEVFMDKLRHALWVMRGKTVAVLGLAFKPLTDDIRESPALRVVEELLKEGAAVRLYDPEAMPNAQQVYPEAPGRVDYCRSAYEAASGAHAVVITTEWDEFRKLNWKKVQQSMEVPVLVDGRNLLDPAAMQEAGFEYFSMGRGSRQPAAVATSAK
ncbi:MAG TPA: UDP-glucose/GDP-mannose dehydrogenase family protein [Terriglobia bacterium]|jgi:UDPglucose 6-dehydrogenase|nr:UDP-glucose/GDP-mannose dehydrogenase family protein [Terriglobia bacterium]